MPTLSRWFIKAGMLYFVVGSAMSALVLAQPVMGWASSWQALRPVYLHFLFIGWVTQIIIGVAFWMFPKYSKEAPRGDERIGWAVFWLLNVGLVLRGIAEPLTVIAPQSAWRWLLPIAALCLLLAGWGFILNTWSRVRER